MFKKAMVILIAGLTMVSTGCSTVNNDSVAKLNIPQIHYSAYMQDKLVKDSQKNDMVLLIQDRQNIDIYDTNKKEFVKSDWEYVYTDICVHRLYLNNLKILLCKNSNKETASRVCGLLTQFEIKYRVEILE